MKKKIMAAVLCTSMLIPTVCVNAETSESDIKSAIEKAIEWKADKDSPFYGIGSYSSDFYIMALNRMGKNYDYSRYLAGLELRQVTAKNIMPRLCKEQCLQR